MGKIKNPFVVAGRIEPPYFCDRESETAALTKSITNGNNVVLISPRRMGKTGLIYHLFEQPDIAMSHNTVFIDILHTTSLREFTYQLGRAFFEMVMPLGSKVVTSFLHTLGSLAGKFSFDAMTGMPTFSLDLGDITRPALTLEEIFAYLEQAPRPCLVAIDEFQQISSYPEKNIEALLRTHVQRAANTRFIFAGSEYHILQEMFISSARPFYNSADILELGPINPDVYAAFAARQFASGGITTNVDAIHALYNLLRGNTYAMQRTLNEAFALLDNGDDCSLDVINTALENTIMGKDAAFRLLLSDLPDRHKDLLYAVALEGESDGIFSVRFVKEHKIQSPSAAQHSAHYLMQRGLMTKRAKVYSLSDRFLELWLKRNYGHTASMPFISADSSPKSSPTPPKGGEAR